jgi:hypothetical protein
MHEAYFPIMIRGKEYLIIQRNNILEIAYDKIDEDVPEAEAEMVADYLEYEGFIK